jgi:predicted ATPase/class 3 adenylate cyclase
MLETRARIARYCPSCGSEVPERFRFCGFCGASLEVSTSGLGADGPGDRSARRWVAIMFADLTNFTRAAERADPEAIYLTIRHALERLAQPVKRLGGRIDRYVGDGFLATFGLPEANEDDSIRAVLAALEMQAAMASLREDASQSLGWDVQLRVGINSGSVISGLLNTGSLLDATVFGHPVNLAKRLQEAARPGTVIVSQTVHRQTHTHFNFREPAKLSLRGIEGTVLGYEVLGRRAEPWSSRGLAGRSTPLVGRDAECDALTAGLQRLNIERKGTIGLVTGEAGIGKSRLVEEALARLPQSVTVVRAQCAPTDSHSYALLGALLENMAGIRPDMAASARQEKLDTLLSISEGLARDFGPVLRALVGGSEGWHGGDPQQQRRGIFAAVRQLLAAYARRRPLALVLDDLQWADPSSLEVFAHAADLVHETPLAVVGISRSPAALDLPPALKSPAATRPLAFVRIDLAGLSPEDSQHLVAMLLSEVALPAEFLRSIAERASGNPLLVEELVRMLLDQEVIRETPEGWRITERWAEAMQQVPHTVSGLILSRYDRLARSLKQVLDAAAVLGWSFSANLLVSMLGLDEPNLRSLLDSLEAADFVRRSSGTGAPVYFFRHALLQEAIYETILQKERRTLHLLAAQAIQDFVEPLAVESAALVGHHLEQAQSALAAKYLIQAAEQAAERFANPEAIAYYRRAEALIVEHGGTQDQALDVALGLAELLTRINRLDEAREQLDRARTLSAGPPRPGLRRGDIEYRLGFVHSLRGQHAEALAAFEAAAAVLLEEPAAGRSFGPSAIEREIGWIMVDQANLPEAQRRAGMALGLAREQSDLAAIGSAHNLLAAVHYYGGQLTASVASALEALAIREQMGDVWGAASTQSNLGLLYHKIGQWAQAEAYLRQAIFVQQEIGDHNGLGLSQNTLGLLLLDFGRYDEALQTLNQALADLRAESEPPSLACLLFLNLGLVWQKLNDLPRAELHFEKGREAAERLNNADLRAWALALLAETKQMAGDMDAARDLIGKALALGQASGSLEARAEVLRVQASVLGQAGQWAEALAAVQEARGLFHQIGNTYQEACRQVDAAEMLLAWHESDRAARLDTDAWNNLVEALRTFRELRAEGDALRAEDLLVKVSARLGAAGAGALRHGQQPVAVVHLLVRAPALAEAPVAAQEGLAEASAALTAALNRIGHDHGAAVANGGAGLVYLLSSAEPEGADSLALKAIRCALAAIEIGLRQGEASRRRYGVDLALSVGIAVGRWQEALHDPQKAALFAAVSQTGRQSARAAALASPNQIVLTSRAARAARSVYELDPLEDQHDGQGAEPVYRLGRAKSEVHLPHALPASSPRLVGRRAELEALSAFVDRLRSQPAGRVCYMEAEAGMGKTRLLEAVIDYAAPDVACLHGKCESFRAEISYWPLVDMLEHTGVEVPAARRLNSLLGLRPPDDAAESLIRSLPPASLRPELFGCVRDYLLQVAALKGHCLLIVEDIHWLDLTTLDLLDYLLPLTLQAPISLMLVARAEMPGPHRALVTKAERVCQSRFAQVDFGGLAEADSRALVQSLLGAEEAPANLGPLLRPFAGHPLSLEEALRFLVERGWLWASDGRWFLADIARSSDRRMPATFKDVLLGRLEALDSETLHVLQAAAVLGESFSRTVLSRIVPAPTLLSRLTELSERGWLLAPQAGNPSQYRFKHTLTRETIYATLLASKRQVLHQRAGEALEALYPEAEEENLELLAYHFGNTGLREKALHYQVRAAEKSAARYALAESLAYFQRAREMLNDQPQVESRLMPRVALGLADAHLALGEPAAVASDVAPVLQLDRTVVATEFRAACLRRLGTARRRMGEYQAALTHLRDAQDLLAAWPEPRASYPRAMADTAGIELLAIELEIAQTLFEMRDNEAAEQQAERVLARLDRRQQPELAAEALNLLGGIAYRAEDAETSARLVQQSLALYQADGNRSGAARAYANLGLLAASRHDAETARDNLALSLAIHEALGNVQGIATTRNNMGQLARNRGAYAEAVQHLRGAVESARQAELGALVAQGLINLAEALRLTGQPGQALPALDECEKVCRDNDLGDLLCEALIRRADCQTDQRRLAEAEAAAVSAIALAEELESSDLLSDAQRALARIHRRQGRFVRAMRFAAAAWEARADDDDKRSRARFAAEYALALRDSGRRQEALELLNQHVRGAVPHESPPVLQEIGDTLSASLSPAR